MENESISLVSEYLSRGTKNQNLCYSDKDSVIFKSDGIQDVLLGFGILSKFEEFKLMGNDINDCIDVEFPPEVIGSERLIEYSKSLEIFNRLAWFMSQNPLKCPSFLTFLQEIFDSRGPNSFYDLIYFIMTEIDDALVSPYYHLGNDIESIIFSQSNPFRKMFSGIHMDSVYPSLHIFDLSDNKSFESILIDEISRSPVVSAPMAIVFVPESFNSHPKYDSIPSKVVLPTMAPFNCLTEIIEAQKRWENIDAPQEIKDQVLSKYNNVVTYDEYHFFAGVFVHNNKMYTVSAKKTGESQLNGEIEPRFIIYSKK